MQRLPRFSGKIILGIHGLNNKPPRRLLRRWWRRALRQGFSSRGVWHPFMRFDLAYWASARYAEPLDPRQSHPDHPLYLAEPFVPLDAASASGGHPVLRQAMLGLLEKSMDKLLLGDDLSLNLSGVTEALVKTYFEDLFVYLSQGSEAEQIRRPLISLLRRHRRKRILLIAHSMGSVVAYDVLKRHLPEVEVDTLITVGSPLGLPLFIHRNASLGRGGRGKKPRVPGAVKRAWHNFSDLHDPIAVNYGLADDYAPNGRGIGVTDWVVENRYVYGGEHNPHKSFGYLQCPELIGVCHDFLRS